MRVATATNTVEYLRTVLKNISAAESLAVVFLSCAERLNQVIVTIRVHLSEEVGASGLKLLPEFWLAATIPYTSIAIHSVLA